MRSHGVVAIMLFLPFALVEYGYSQTPQCALATAQPGVQVFTLSASSGSPLPQNPPGQYVFHNNKTLDVRLTDINPFAFQCSVSTSSQPFTETAISGFLGIVGGVANVGATTTTQPTAAPPKGGGAPRDIRVNNTPQPAVQQTPCVNHYLDQVHNQQIIPLTGDRDSINAALQVTLNAEQQALHTFSQDVMNLRSQTSCVATVLSATALVNQPPFAISPVNGALPLDQAIDQISSQAQSLLTHLTDGMDSTCKASLEAMVNEDTAFLSTLVHGTTAVPAVVDQWRSQLAQLNSVNDSLASARATVQAVLQNRQNFTVDTSLTGNQLDTKVTASCTPVAVLQVSASSAAGPNRGASPAPAAQTALAKPVPNTWIQDFKFGPGPRFVLSGGLVISPLQQIVYSTSSNPAGGTPANIIIRQQNSSTRILPIAMLSGRFWDQLPYETGYSFLPSYLSVGVTAKSTGTTSGTNIEYLLGFSWALAERQLFITAGAYAGWQQRLGGGLTVGQATALSSANLPISSTTVWKPGFSITWAPAAK